jgi:alpha-soluble NSF attachment protein
VSNVFFKISFNTNLCAPPSTAMACLKDAADLHADLEDYPQAIARYEQVANHSLGSSLTKYSVKEYWLRASLCGLAQGV